MGTSDNWYLYEVKESLLSIQERKFYDCIKSIIPENYIIIPQSNLATFIKRTDKARYQNELYRNIDFLITDSNFKPFVAIEINDQTHNNRSRKERDEKIHKICEEAGIEIVTFWTSYGVNADYISNRINTALSNFPPERKHNFTKQEEQIEEQQHSALDIDDATKRFKDQIQQDQVVGQEKVYNNQAQKKDNKKLVLAGFICSIISLIISAFPLLLNQPFSKDILSIVLLLTLFGIISGIIGVKHEKTIIIGIVTITCGVLALVFSLLT